MDGYLLIDKPAGWTSFDMVNRVRHIIQNSGLNTTGKKRFPVGHAGTLDPLATGLMLVMLGKYTKRAAEFTKLDKTYQVTARLGQISTTGDEEGSKTPVSDQQPTPTEVTNALHGFLGEITQTPPAFSAVKVNGKRAYQLARAGKAPKIGSRLVKIYQIENIEYQYPDVSFAVRVSSGTYIRSLVEDLGTVLTTGAYTADLRRTKVAAYDVTDALAVDKLSPESIYQNLRVVS